MLRIFITFRVLPDDKRYILLSKSMSGNNQRAAIYKRYLSIFYVRVSPVYTGYECITIAVNKYNELTKNK
jgi:hypothetical protein